MHKDKFFPIWRFDLLNHPHKYEPRTDDLPNRPQPHAIRTFLRKNIGVVLMLLGILVFHQ